MTTARERVLDYIWQIKNPYYCRYDGMIVIVRDRGRAQLECFISMCLLGRWGIENEK